MAKATPSLPARENYAQYFMRFIAVNMDTSTGEEEDFRTVSGKVIDVAADAMAIRMKNRTVIVPFRKIIGEVELLSAITRDKVQIRKVLEAGDMVRQHLADRHGLPISKVGLLDEASAALMHEHIDHGPLGHAHAGQLVRSEADPTKKKRLTQRYVDDTEKTTRQHMADRHGTAVAILNATNDTMLKFMHDNLNHDGLSHRHTEEAAVSMKVPKQRTQSIASPPLPALTAQTMKLSDFLPPLLPQQRIG